MILKKCHLNIFINKKLFSQRSADRSIDARRFQEVKEKFEVNVSLIPEAYVLVNLDGVNFKKFCSLNSLLKPVDQRHVNLMNHCARNLMEHYQRDIVYAFGFSDEFNFILKTDSELYKRNSK